MWVVRLVYNHSVLILFPIIGPFLALKNRGPDAFMPDNFSLKKILEHIGVMLIMFGMPLILLSIILAKIIGLLINTFTPFSAVGFLGLKKNDRNGKDILIFINNTLFRGAQWISEINGYEQDYYRTKIGMKKILENCCRKY